MNDGSKEPQEQDDYSASSAEKLNWFWASVEVHIQNLEWIGPKEVHIVRGRIIKIEE